MRPASAEMAASPAASQPASNGSPESVIEVTGLGKKFGDTYVVQGLSFAVAKGTIFGLFGPSGSGKTTTLRMLLGLLKPDDGTATVLGREPQHFTGRTRAQIGYLPQLFVLYPELTIQENLSLVASLYGLGWPRRSRSMKRVLELVELWDDRRKRASELSGGMQRRLELACALVHDPALLIVDEPTAGIDPILRAKFWDHFRELRDQGRTLIVTSQYVTEAEYCDTAAVLADGRVIACNTPEGLRDQAMGGEIVEASVDGVNRRLLDALEHVEGVRRVQAIAFDQIQMSVDEASEAIPRLLDVLQEHGAEVRSVTEHRPNFDEVFVKLVEQSEDGIDQRVPG
jgi:ABC-2 type transport system ATP-binding protein